MLWCHLHHHFLKAPKPWSHAHQTIFGNANWFSSVSASDCKPPEDSAQARSHPSILVVDHLLSDIRSFMFALSSQSSWTTCDALEGPWASSISQAFYPFVVWIRILTHSHVSKPTVWRWTYQIHAFSAWGNVIVLNWKAKPHPVSICYHKLSMSITEQTIVRTIPCEDTEEIENTDPSRLHYFEDDTHIHLCLTWPIFTRGKPSFSACVSYLCI